MSPGWAALETAWSCSLEFPLPGARARPPGPHPPALPDLPSLGEQTVPGGGGKGREGIQAWLVERGSFLCVEGAGCTTLGSPRALSPVSRHTVDSPGRCPLLSPKGEESCVLWRVPQPIRLLLPSIPPIS